MAPVVEGEVIDAARPQRFNRRHELALRREVGMRGPQDAAQPSDALSSGAVMSKRSAFTRMALGS